MNRDADGYDVSDVIDEILREMEQSENDILLTNTHEENLQQMNESHERIQNRSLNLTLEKEELQYNSSDSDEDLIEFIAQMKTKVIVIGIGGAGNNILTRLYDAGTPFVETLAVNTDAQDLFSAISSKKLLIGKKVTCGFGSGNDPDKGRLAAVQDRERILPYVQKDIVILLCGLGGGTGSGAGPYIAELAKEMGSIVISVCTLPFDAEGKQKELIAYRSLHQLAKFSDAVLPMPNNTITSIFPNINMLEGFRLMDEMIGKKMRAITDLVSGCGLINLDLADIKNVLDSTVSDLDLEQKTGFISVGEIELSEEYSDSMIPTKMLSKFAKEKIQKETLKILSNPMTKTNIKKIDRCIIAIKGSQRMTLVEINEIINTITQNIHANATVKFGTYIDPNAESIKISIIGRSCKSEYLLKCEELFGPIIQNHPNKLINTAPVIQNRLVAPEVNMLAPKINVAQHAGLNEDGRIADQALKTHFRLKASNIISSTTQQEKPRELKQNNFISSALKRRLETNVRPQSNEISNDRSINYGNKPTFECKETPEQNGGLKNSKTFDFFI